jgi:hypothetical protein
MLLIHTLPVFHCAQLFRRWTAISLNAVILWIA